jgi:hypothetical protein
MDDIERVVARSMSSMHKNTPRSYTYKYFCHPLKPDRLSEPPHLNNNI